VRYFTNQIHFPIKLIVLSENKNKNLNKQEKNAGKTFSIQTKSTAKKAKKTCVNVEIGTNDVN
jgi:hypothetical protein